MAKFVNPDLAPEAMEARLTSIARQVVATVAHDKSVKHDHAFESGSDEFGLFYGVSKILDKVKQKVAIVREGKANEQGDVFVELVDDVIGYSLLLRDYINRNPHLVASINKVATSVANGEKKVDEVINKVEQGIDRTISEAATLLHNIVEKAEEAFKPEIPQTTEGVDPNYNAR
jgi:hypothetical protein